MTSSAAMDFGIDRGVFVRGTPLWVDAQRRKSHTILTALRDKLPARHDRLLTSIHIAAMLDRAGMQAVVLPATFRQWMGFGGRQVQLVDLGSEAGEVGVLFDDGIRRTLVLSRLPAKIASLPPVDHLVLGGAGLMHRGVSLEEGLSGHVRGAAAGHRTVVRVETLEVGLRVLALLEDAGICAQPAGFLGRLAGRGKVNRKAWAVAFNRDKIQVSREVVLDTGGGGDLSEDALKVAHYGGLDTLAGVLEMVGAHALSLYDVQSDFSLPESLTTDLCVTVHRPREKSMGLGFESLPRL